MEELAGQEASLRLREQLLQQEKQLVKNQNDWLSRELQTKSEELLQLRKEKGETVANLEGRLAAKEQEVRAEWWLGNTGLSLCSVGFLCRHTYNIASPLSTLCMSVCVIGILYMYVVINTLQTRTHTYTHTLTHTHMHMHAHTRLHTHLLTLHALTHTHTHTYTHTLSHLRSPSYS